MTLWKGLKNILVIRPDNRGDLLLSSPAIRALKESFGSRITLLAASSALEVTYMLPEIDEVIVANLPWVRLNEPLAAKEVHTLIEKLTRYHFDACVIFTVYSQNPLPAALLAWMAEIPNRLAYCRENPYGLLDCWVPEKEPYEFIKHQTERDLNLVERVGAVTKEKKIKINIQQHLFVSLKQQLLPFRRSPTQKYFVLHAGVSEQKRKVSEALWVALAKELIATFGSQIFFTGSRDERVFTDRLQQQVGEHATSLGGLLSFGEFAALIHNCTILIAVNTVAIHLAAATNTPQVVLYARTNPQHTPWMSPHRVLEYNVPDEDKSKNEIIKYVDRTYYADFKAQPAIADIIMAVRQLL